MSLSSRVPNAASARTPSGSAFSDALTSMSIPHLFNSAISNSIICGIAQATGLDNYLSPPPGSGALQQAIYDGVYCSLVNQSGTMLRQAVPMLRVW